MKRRKVGFCRTLCLPLWTGCTSRRGVNNFTV